MLSIYITPTYGESEAQVPTGMQPQMPPQMPDPNFQFNAQAVAEDRLWDSFLSTMEIDVGSGR